MPNSARRRALLALSVLPFSASAATAQSCPDAALLTRGLEEPLATVRFLADDALAGRLAGSPGERCAADYIARRLEQIGLRGAGTDGSFFQDVPVPVPTASANPHAADPHASVTGRNIIALLEGSDPRLRDQVVVIGAHYDHLGLGGSGSLAPGESAIHNGADDNASGVAAMLRAAEMLSEGPRPARSILFIAFTGEEYGLLGSAFFARAPTVDLDRARAMLNLDMVGRLENDALIVYGVGTAAEWTDLVEHEAAGVGIEVALQPDGVGPSDHTSFYLRDIPVLHFFTNTHGDYHRPSDDWQTVDAAGMERVAVLVASLARQVATREAALTLQRGAGQPAGAPRSGSGAWLGTVPDFSPVEHGVLLGGVTAGSPADRAGMRKGDILIGLGGHAVRDLQGFTDALAAHKPGDEVNVVVIREGREVRLQAVLGRRGG
ncbi:MAG TPA: M20/M25/M40 family metallo-hydrolase [Longimicrobiales bacterium]|nr:M20/M25/M40 family metallo-hydrolase [Longimicrobiales bacterium]